MNLYRLLCLMLAGSLLLPACGSKSDKPQLTQSFALSDSLMKNLALDTVKMSTVYEEIHLNGRITFDEDKVVKIYPLVGGNVLAVNVALGDYVTRGQALATIKSGQMAELEEDLFDAQSDLTVARKNLAVTEDLYKSGLSAQREVLVAREQLQKAEVRLNKTQEVLKIYKTTDQNDYVVKAPVSGYVVQKNLSEDMTLRGDLGEPVFVISSLDEVWAMAEVFEGDIPKLKQGMPAEVTTLSYPNRHFAGQVDRIFEVLDPKSRTLKARIRLPNTERVLKPEMFAGIKLKRNLDHTMLAVPNAALLFLANKHYVIVFRDQKNIELREVQISQQNETTAYIGAGVVAGERVISHQTLLVYNALTKR